MKKIKLGSSSLVVPEVIVGCMRLCTLDEKAMNSYIHKAIEAGINFFDHADIYGDGQSEIIFGETVKKDNSLKREDMIIQSKCGIRKGYYDLSKEYIIKSVDGILKRLQTDYLDILLLHRPDALVEPEEVAEAFEKLEQSGKVKAFGVSNHKPMQIELLKKYVKQDLIVNQLQLSIPVSNMIANGMEVNMETYGASDRDGSVLDYCRLNDITIQAWSPFQMPNWKGPFLGSNEYEELNKTIREMADKYNATETMIAAAWILRHPANIQVIAGTTNEDRLMQIAAASDVNLLREDWYKLYLAAGHPLP
ncbi:aldo/keto reductase family oxidoreductase [uncultured Clostridium sp.]|uniref:aldo/keto reductase n=1 Tax=uncultured Clostridium sp. TaxID=59620 RepID=UPI0025F3EEF9|nr:aldo/keto reductase [uncultured Clostridium sp.]